MKKLFSKIKKLNKFHFITWAIFLLIVIVGSILNRYVYPRIIFSIKMGFNYFIFYFKYIFDPTTQLPYGIHNLIIDSNAIGGIVDGTPIPLIPHFFIPDSVDKFTTYLTTWFFMLWNKEYFYNSTSIIVNIALNLNVVILVIISIASIGFTAYTIYFIPKDANITGETKGLIKLKKFEARFITPVINFIKNYIKFFNDRNYYLYILIALIMFYTNLMSIAIETFSYIFAWCANVTDVLIPLYIVFSALYTFYPTFVFFPLLMWIILALIIFNVWRKKHARDKFDKMIQKIKDFIKQKIGVAAIFTGPPGSGKTTFISYLSIIKESMDKDFYKEVISYYENLFNNFDFRKIQKWVTYLHDEGFKDGDKTHVITNSIQIKFIIIDLQKLIEEGNKDKIKNFVDKYRFPNKDLKIEKIEPKWDYLHPVTVYEMLEDYCPAYFLYVLKQTLITANLTIRSSQTRKDDKYFPSIDFDPFNEKSCEDFKEKTIYSMDVDYDKMRLGKRFKFNVGMLDCGIVLLTEIGKDRGNRNTNTDFDKTDYLPNPKNDEFNTFMKLGRHPYTIMFKPMLTILCDEQRAGSVNSDLYDLFETSVDIAKNDKQKNALIGFAIEQPFLEESINFITGFLNKYKETRNYESKTYYIVNKILKLFNLYYLEKVNCYSYHTVELNVDIKGNSEQCELSLINKYAYSGRFATDCYRDFFRYQLDPEFVPDIKEEQYSNLHPSQDDFDSQNSHFINKIESTEAFSPQYHLIFELWEKHSKEILKELKTNGSKAKYGRKDLFAYLIKNKFIPKDSDIKLVVLLCTYFKITFADYRKGKNKDSDDNQNDDLNNEKG